MIQSQFPLVSQVVSTPKIQEKAAYTPQLKQFSIQRTAPMQVRIVANIAGTAGSYITQLLFDNILIRDRSDDTATVGCLDESKAMYFFSPISVTHDCVCSCTCQDFYWNQKRYQDRLLAAKKENVSFTDPPPVCKHLAGLCVSLLRSKVLLPSGLLKV